VRQSLSAIWLVERRLGGVFGRAERGKWAKKPGLIASNIRRRKLGMRGFSMDDVNTGKLAAIPETDAPYRIITNST
jgi:hypothetical protein